MKLDLHNHTNHSGDGLTKPETLLRVAQKKGLVVAVADHNTTGAWKFLAAQKGAGERVIFGEEITTTKNGEDAGHLLGLFMNTPVKATEYAEVIDELKKQGALLVVPHPFDTMRCAFQRLEEIKCRIDLVEVLNARAYSQGANKAAEEFAKRNNLARCAGSDSHTIGEIGAAYVEVEASGIEEARRKLLRNECTVHGKITGLVPHAKTALAKFGVMKPR